MDWNLRPPSRAAGLTATPRRSRRKAASCSGSTEDQNCNLYPIYSAVSAEGHLFCDCLAENGVEVERDEKDRTADANFNNASSGLLVTTSRSPERI